MLTSPKCGERTGQTPALEHFTGSVAQSHPTASARASQSASIFVERIASAEERVVNLILRRNRVRIGPRNAQRPAARHASGGVSIAQKPVAATRRCVPPGIPKMTRRCPVERHADAFRSRFAASSWHHNCSALLTTLHCSICSRHRRFARGRMFYPSSSPTSPTSVAGGGQALTADDLAGTWNVVSIQPVNQAEQAKPGGGHYTLHVRERPCIDASGLQHLWRRVYACWQDRR